MTYKQGVRIATRTIAIYLVIIASLDALNLLDSIPSWLRILHLSNPALPNTVYAHPPRNISGELMWTAFGLLALTVIKIAGCLFAARWFYACGSWLRRFFGVADELPVGEEPS
jgi:hypothetical protein